MALVVAVGLAASLCAADSAAALAATGSGATTQFADVLETDAREQLVSLHATELENSEVAMVWTVARLPCAKARYRFSATEASIDSAQTNSSEARIQLLSAHLPHGVHCGLELPADVSRGSMTIVVSPMQANGSAGPPFLSYSDRGVNIESFSACLTLSDICAGRYLLTALFISPSRRIMLVYDFTIAIAKSAAQSAGAHKVQSCPIL